MPTSPRRCWPADQGSYIIGFILYVAYVIPRILQKFQTEGWHVVVDASCAPYWDLIQHLQSCAEKVCWGTHTLVELRSGSSFDVNGRVRRSAEPRAFFEFEQRRSTTYSVLNSGCASMLRASPLAEVPLVVKFKIELACQEWFLPL